MISDIYCFFDWFLLHLLPETQQWTNSANISQHRREIQGKTNFLAPDHVDNQSIDSESTDVSSMDMNHPSTSKVSTDENYPSIKDKLKQERKLAKLKKKYCHLNNFVKKVVTKEETKTNNENVNVGYLYNKQLMYKLENIETKSILNAKKKKNRNGKVGINKHSNYTPDMCAPRKVCSKCGSVNHLVMHCKVVVPPMISPSMPTLVDQNFNGLAQFLSYLIFIMIMEMQTCLLCHGVNQLLITHLFMHILKMLAKVILNLEIM